MAYFGTWAQGLSIQTVGEDLCFWPAPNFGPKTGLNLDKDFLFFRSSSNFGQENGPILGGKIFILILVMLKFSEFPGPSPSKILRMLLERTIPSSSQAAIFAVPT